MKKNTKEKPEKKQSKKPKWLRIIGVIFKSLGKLIAVSFLTLLITCCIAGTVLTVFVMHYIETDSGIDLDDVELGYTTVVYGLNDAGEYQEIQKIASNGKREWVDIENIPQHVQDAFVYAEDERFMEHEGVDWLRTIAAFGQMVVDRFTGKEDNSYGASTITQQLIKNVNGDFDNRTPTVKIKEILTSLSVEKYNTKDTILECYLNYVNLGNNIYGVGSASKEYFGKDVSELSVVEAAALAITIKAPDTYNPLDNPENNAKRRAVSISKMLEFGTIDQAQYDEAMAAALVLKDHSDDEQTKTNSVYNWYVDAALQSVAEELAAQKGYEYKTALQEVRSGGYQIYTPVNISMQNQLEQLFLDNSIFYSRDLINEPQAAMVIMDYTGNVVACVGGRGEKTSSLCWNRVTQDVRSMGSCMKPITTYALALQTDLITYSTAFIDEPKRSKAGGKDAEPDWPKNFNRVWSKKAVPAVEALRVSKNTIPVELMQLLGNENCYNFLEDELGVTTLVPDSQDMSENLTLGMTTKGLYLDEATAAYLMFGNGGRHYTPKYYTKVVDVSGRVIMEQNDTGNMVLESDTAYIMNKMLNQVVTGTGGTGKAAQLRNIEVVGKTGTSDDNKEISFVGLTPYYAASVRIGYDQTPEFANHNVKNASYSSSQVWKNIMSVILDGYAPANFNLSSEGVVTKKYCTETGLIATDKCPSTATGYYKTGIYPQTCAKDHSATVTKTP